MQFNLLFTSEAKSQLKALERESSQWRQLAAVRKTLGLMQTNMRPTSLNTHEYTELSKRYGVKTWEAYAQNKTPGAYRVFFQYGPAKGDVTIVSITPHP